MFTFVREMIKRPAQDREIEHSCPPAEIEDITPEPISAHPWQQELERLASCQCPGSEWPKSKYRSYSAGASVPQKPIRQGTLTDQRAWWGRALNHNTLTPEQGLLTQYRRPPKTINHWQQ